MPPRASLAPWGFPIRLPFFFRLPKDEVQWILLFLPCHLNFPVPCLQVVQIFVGQLAVFLKFPCAEIHGPICRRVSVTLFNQGGNHFQHPANLLRCQGMGSGRLYVHGSHVFLALRNITLGNFLGSNPFFHGFFDDFIIYIGEIRHKIHFIAFVFHVTPYRVKDNHGPCIPNMDKIVYGRPAHIHFYFPFLQRDKFLFLPA